MPLPNIKQEARASGPETSVASLQSRGHVEGSCDAACLHVTFHAHAYRTQRAHNIDVLHSHLEMHSSDAFSFLHYIYWLMHPLMHHGADLYLDPLMHHGADLDIDLTF